MDLKETIDLRLQDPDTILEIYRQWLGDYIKQNEKEYKFSSYWNAEKTPSMGVDPNRMGLFKDMSSGNKGNIYSFLKTLYNDGKLNKKPLIWLAEYFSIEISKDTRPKLVAPMNVMLSAKKFLQANPQYKKILYEKGFGDNEIDNFNNIGIGYLDNDIYRKRFFIPIIDDHDELVDIRLYDPTHSSPGMKCIHFYLYLDNINNVPQQIQDAMNPDLLAKLKRGEAVKLTGFGKSRLANLRVFENDEPIYIMEGERDMMNALRTGLNATCVTGGADAWEYTFNSRCRGKDIIIVMDNDDAGLRGAYKKANALSGVAKSIKVIKLPLEAKGSDFADYIKDHTAKEFLSLVDAAVEYRTTHTEKHKPKIEIDPSSTARMYAQYLESTMDIMFVNKQGFYVYQTEGFWKSVDDNDLECQLNLIYDKFRYKEPTKRNVTEAMFSLRYCNYKEDRPDNEHRYINCRNGLYDINQKILIPHTKNIFTTQQLPLDFDPAASCPRFIQYLEEVFPKDTDQFKDLIGEILGYCLTADTSFQKAFIFMGTGANGKSVMIDILESLVGKENVSSVGFNELCNSFSRSQLKDKLINVGAEIEFSTTANSSYFKQIVAGDTISAQEKYKPEFIFKPKVKLVYSTNGFPSTKDRTEGNFRRYLFVPFNVYFPEDKQDKQLTNKLKKELQGILNFAIAGMKRLYHNGKFTSPRACQDMLQEFKATSSPLTVFVNEVAVIDRAKRYSRASFIKKYKDWCFENGYKSMSTQRVTKELNECFSVGLERNSDGWYYVGVYLPEESELWGSAISTTAEAKEQPKEKSEEERLVEINW